MFYQIFKKIFIYLFLTLNLIAAFCILYVGSDFFSTNWGRGHIWAVIFLALFLLVNYFLYGLIVKTKYVGFIAVTFIYSFIVYFLLYIVKIQIR